MKKEKAIQKLKEKFADRIINWKDRSAKRIYVDIRPDDIPEMARHLFKDLKARFVTASGVDMPKAIELLYHFSFDKGNLILSLRTAVAKPGLEIESITPIIKGAEWIEREIWELLGVKFKNHPNLKRLLMAEDWPEGVYPLRRE